jgi:hypothetical protein
MNKITLERNLTRKYALGWASCDEWQELGEAKLLPPNNVRQDEKEGTANWTQRLIVSHRVADRHLQSEILEAINDTFTSSRCTHEYDCCGCISYHAWGQRVGAREYLINFYSSRNI